MEHSETESTGVTLEEEVQDITDLLHQLESEIKRHVEEGLCHFEQAGRLWDRIREEKLYRDHYATWKAYLREKWNRSDAVVGQWINASRAVSFLREVFPDIEVPTTVRDANDLYQIAQREGTEAMVEAFKATRQPGSPKARERDSDRRARWAKGDIPRKPTVQLTLGPQEAQLLAELAEKKGWSMADTARWMLSRSLKRLKEDEEDLPLAA